MNEYINIPAPISFNPLKHHLAEIKSFLDSASAEDIDYLISAINHNNIDLYIGEYSVSRICDFTIGMLIKTGKFDREEYNTWLGERGKYQVLDFDDGSSWILLKGDSHERYIHIHPAKSGQYTARYRGATLKTVFKLKSDLTRFSQELTLDSVNDARLDVGLSPIKKLTQGKGIMKCWEFFSGA